jgi:hypothetical protein
MLPRITILITSPSCFLILAGPMPGPDRPTRRLRGGSGRSRGTFQGAPAISKRSRSTDWNNEAFASELAKE